MENKLKVIPLPTPKGEEETTKQDLLNIAEEGVVEYILVGFDEEETLRVFSSASTVRDKVYLATILQDYLKTLMWCQE
jgi:hypothetical protein